MSYTVIGNAWLDGRSIGNLLSLLRIIATKDQWELHTRLPTELWRRYDRADVPSHITELSVLYIEGVILHSMPHQCLPSTGGVGKVVLTKVCLRDRCASTSNRAM